MGASQWIEGQHIHPEAVRIRSLLSAELEFLVRPKNHPLDGPVWDDRQGRVLKSPLFCGVRKASIIADGCGGVFRAAMGRACAPTPNRRQTPFELSQIEWPGLA